MSYTELILLDAAPDDPRRQDLMTIRDAAVRAADLTRQILVFSRAKAVQPRAIELNGLVQGLDKLLRRIIGEDIELVTIVGDVETFVEADPGHLEADLVSSVVAAREAVDDGGSITIRIGPGRRGDTVCLEVSHSGGGAPLATELPRAEAPAGRTPPPPPARGTETIVVAEDNDMLRRGIIAMLSGRGFKVLAAATGEEAVRIVKAVPEVRLVLADVVMPNMSAADLDRQLKSARSDVGIVFMSGYADDAVSRGIVRPSGFIAKPFTGEQLARLVREVLDSPARL